MYETACWHTLAEQDRHCVILTQLACADLASLPGTRISFQVLLHQPKWMNSLGATALLADDAWDGHSGPIGRIPAVFKQVDLDDVVERLEKKHPTWDSCRIQRVARQLMSSNQKTSLAPNVYSLLCERAQHYITFLRAVLQRKEPVVIAFGTREQLQEQLAIQKNVSLTELSPTILITMASTELLVISGFGNL